MSDLWDRRDEATYAKAGRGDWYASLGGAHTIVLRGTGPFEEFDVFRRVGPHRLHGLGGNAKEWMDNESCRCAYMSGTGHRNVASRRCERE